MTLPSGQEELPPACPYLGLGDDSESHATYATEAHRCYRLDNPTRIATNHQEAYCLGASHTQCPVYKGEGIAAAAPPAAAAAAATGAAAASAATPSAARSPFDRRGGTPGATPRPSSTPSRPPGSRSGTLSPRPRPGGISLPVATIGLFVLAVVVIALAFWIQSVVGGDDDDDDIPAAELTQTAQTQTANAGNGGTEEPGSPTGEGSPGATETPGEGTPTPGGEGTYTIQAGDTCFSIAEANGVTLEEFQIANNLDDEGCTQLEIGQVVIIP